MNRAFDAFERAVWSERVNRYAARAAFLSVAYVAARIGYWACHAAVVGAFR